MRLLALAPALLLALAPGLALGRAGGGSNYRSSSPSRSSSSSSSSRSSSSSSHSYSSSPSHSSSSSYSSSSSHSSSYSSPSYHSSPSSSSPSSSYSSSSYSSSSSSSGGSGFVCLLVCLVLLVIVLAVVLPQITSHNATRDAIEEMTGPTGRDPDAIVRELRTEDPAFEPVAFMQKVRFVFSEVQEAWFRRDYQAARAFMSDGVLRRFMSQQKLMEVEGVRNAVADMKVLDVRLLDCATTPFFHVVDVCIEASARDTDVDASTPDAQARRVAASASVQRFTEVWTFARRPGAKTKAGFSLAEGKCPNCGAAYQGGPSSQCAYCGAVVNSGNYDWVLCEITQAEEHRLARPLSDFAEMLAKDPGFNPYAVEDRASLVFWKLLQARANNAVAPLAAVCAPELGASEARKITERAGRSERMSYAQAAVGAVELVALDVATAAEPGDLDRAHVRINWSARTRVVRLGEAAREAMVSSRSTVFTLVRRAEAQTPPNRGLATSRCGNCGAAATRDDLDACESCGTALGATRSDWVLEAEAPYERWLSAREQRASAPAAGQAVPHFAYPSERRRLLHTMSALALADGEVSDQERELLHACADRWHLPRTEVDALLDGRAAPEMDLPEPGSPASRAFLEGLVQVALVDGRIDSGERKLLQSVAGSLHLPPNELGGVIAQMQGGAR